MEQYKNLRYPWPSFTAKDSDIPSRIFSDILSSSAMAPNLNFLLGTKLELSWNLTPQSGATPFSSLRYSSLANKGCFPGRQCTMLVLKEFSFHCSLFSLLNSPSRTTILTWMEDKGPFVMTLFSWSYMATLTGVPSSRTTIDLLSLTQNP